MSKDSLIFHRQDTEIQTPDGLKLHTTSWIPKTDADLNHVILVHGIGEYLERYVPIIRDLKLENVCFHGMDLRGHGRSEGKKGHATGIDQYCDDLNLLIEHVQKRHSVGQAILLGHSLGGLISLRYVTRPHFSSMIKAIAVSAPALGVDMTFTMKTKRILATVLKKVYPSLTLPIGLELSKISRDPGTLELYNKDPLIHGVMSVQLAVDTLDTGNLVRDMAPSINIPIYMAHGSADGIAKAEMTISFFNSLTEPNRIIHIYEGLHHEIFNEIPRDREIVLSDLRVWLSETFSKLN